MNLVSFPIALALLASGHMFQVQQSGGCEPGWRATFGSYPGTNSYPRALAVFDDGTGGGPALYAAGQFTIASGVWANRIAKWDGLRWSPLASGLNGDILSLTVFDDGSGGGPALYAGGVFTAADGVPASNIAKWDGLSWAALGSGIAGSVVDLTVFDDGSGGGPALYAGGYFTVAGGISANHVAKWDGASWSPLGGGMSSSLFLTGVRVLTVFDDGAGAGPALYAGGAFTVAGGVVANRIAKWNGAQWSALGNGMPLGAVFALATFDDGGGGGSALYAAGRFVVAGGVSASRIAKWDGVSWSPLGSGITGSYLPEVRTLAVFDDGGGSGPALYAGGRFGFAGGASVNRIAKWDGSIWSALGSSTMVTDTREVSALAVFDDGTGNGPALFAGGDFQTVGGELVNYIARWDGSIWSTLGSGLTNPSGLGSVVVHALAEFDDGSGAGPAVYAGGTFTNVGPLAVNYIAKWDGTSWSPLGSGVDRKVWALAVFDDGKGGGPRLFAGGRFFVAGGMPASNIASWDGSNWSAVGSGISGPNSNSGVRALMVFDDGGGPALYAGGRFTIAGGVAATRIARWDGSSWSALGGFMDKPVDALAMFDDGSGSGPALFAAGTFTSPGAHIAKWDGTNWSALGAGMDAPVFALTAFDDGGGPALYAGGVFSSAGGVAVNRIAKWNGSWSAAGAPAGMNNSTSVQALTVFDDRSGSGPALYAGLAGLSLTNRIVRWNGASWSHLGDGMNGSVEALTVLDDGQGGGPALFAGGSFSASSSGDAYVAQRACSSPPQATVFCTAKTTLVCGPASIGWVGSPSATRASGFVVQAHPVRECRAGLLLYSNRPEQPGASFGGFGNGLLCLSGTGLRHAGPIESSSSSQPCDGTLAIDMNQFHTLNWTASGCNPPPGQTLPAAFLDGMGTTVKAQMWARDATTTGQVVTGGLSWVIGP